MAKAATFVFALWDGDSHCMFARFQVVKIEEHGVSGSAGTPARTRVVR